MRIALLAPLWKEVPPAKYAGTELVVANLAEGFVSRGHEVTVFACKGSKVAGRLVEVIDRPMYDLLRGFSWSGVPGYEFLEYDELFKRLSEFDLIHNHTGFHVLVFTPLVSVPVVTTLHSSLPPDFPYLSQRFKDRLFVSVSHAQRQLAPYLNFVATISHGIKTADFQPDYDDKTKDYLLFLGSLTHHKGVDRAIQTASDLNQNLILAGEVRASEKEFLDKEVWPYVDEKQIKYVGEVDQVTKAKLLAGAKALLFPVRWIEAFGLVMPEALACGTPIIAYNNGSVPEVVEHGRTGFIVNSQEELNEAVRGFRQISRAECRKVAEERFDLSIMSDNYLKLFEKILKGQA